MAGENYYARRRRQLEEGAAAGNRYCKRRVIQNAAARRYRQKLRDDAQTGDGDSVARLNKYIARYKERSLLRREKARAAAEGDQAVPVLGETRANAGVADDDGEWSSVDLTMHHQM